MAKSELTVKIGIDMSSFEGAIDGITEKLGSIASSIDASGISQMFSSIAGTMDSVSAQSGIFTTLTEGINGFIGAASAISGIAPAIASLGPSFMNIMAAGKGLVPIIKSIMTAFLGLSPMTMIIMALAAVFVGLLATNEEFRNSVMGLFSLLASSLMSIFETLIAVFGMIITAVAPLIQQIASALIPVFQAIMPVVTAIVGFIGTAITTIITKITPIIAFIAGVIAKVVTAITSKIGPVVEFIAGVITSIVTVFRGIISKVSEIFGNVKTIITGVFDKIRSAWDGLTGFVGKVTSGISKAFDDLVSNVKKAINFVTSGINSAIGLINKIPGVNIPKIPQLYNGTNNFAGGFAYINEGGRGELTYLPNGSQVIPHDISVQYAKESARANSNNVIDPAAIQEAMYSAVAQLSNPLKQGMKDAVDGIDVVINGREFNRVIGAIK